MAVNDEPEGSLSPWSVGSDAVFAPTAPPVFDAAEAPTHRREVDAVSTPPRQVVRTRTVAVLMGVSILLALMAVGRFFLAGDLTGDVGPSASLDIDDVGDVGVTSGNLVAPLVTEPFAGADRRRLPGQLDQRWRFDLAGVSATGRTRLSVLDDGAVTGVFDDDSIDDGQPASVVVLLDGEDGSERWRTPFDSHSRAFKVLGHFGDVIVLERLDTDHRAVLGLSVDTGAVLWVRDTKDPGVHVVLEGTELVARVSFTVNARLTFIDPASGDEVGRVPGRLFATDFLGTWYVRSGAVASELDLRDGWNPPTPFETLWVDDDEPASVVGGRLLVIDNGILEVRGDGGYPTGVATIGAAGSGGFAGLDTGANFSQLSPMVDNSFIVVGSRSVFGAELDDNGDADVRWRASGVPIESRPTDRGLSLVVATEGGASQSVIDASTGSEIALVEMVPGSIDTLQLVGNGVVVKQAARIGFERVGLDLDGNRLWSLVGEGPLAIGPGVVVTYGPSDSGVAVTSYGDAST